ncbi:cytochrome c biogenesis protein CcsA [Salmonella enterica]|nr:cytochrome c biogenesis protein CcsA [Salmonella enterica]
MAILSAVIALVCHAVALESRILPGGDSGQNLSLLNVGSLVSLMICTVMTIVASRNRGWLLLPIVYAFALINLAFATFMPNEYITHLEATPGMMVHIGLSLFSYATLIIAALYPEKVAYPSSFLLAPLQILMMPLVWLLNTITRLLMRLMGIKTDIVVSGSLSKEELRTIVHESRSQISRRNQDMLLSVLDLEKVSVDDIMVPRNEIIGIDINDDWKSIERQLTHSPHGRIVLYRDSLDDAISMLRVREAWRLMAEKKEFTKEMMLRAADEIYYVPEGTPLSTQLIKFQRNKKKVGLVVNEYGDIQGLVTVEDILEEIVGDFTTSMSPTLAEEVTPQNDGSVIIDGTANVREINKAFNWHLPEDDARTVNGVILEALEEIPVAGTRVRIEQYDIDILDVQENMIKQVKVVPVKPLRESVAE